MLRTAPTPEEKEFISGRRDVFNSEHVVPQALALVA
jgi:hypothetical protein